MSYAPFAFTVLPIVLLAVLILHPRPLKTPGRRTPASARLILWSLGLIPLSLLLLAQGEELTRSLASALSALAVLAGGYRLAGRRGTLAAGGLLALVWSLSGPARLAAFDGCSLLAGVGAGALLAQYLGSRRLVFLALLAGVDCLVVGFGLTAGAVQAAMLGPMPALALTPPVFAGVALDGLFLGALDLAAVTIVAAEATARGQRAQSAYKALEIVLVLGLAQAALVGVGSVLDTALPATLPALVTALALRRQAPTAREPA